MKRAVDKGSPDAWQWVWILALSMWAGLIGHLHRLKRKKLVIRCLIVDVGASILAGLIAAFLCVQANMNEWMTYTMVSVSAHMGVRIITQFEAFIDEKLSTMFKR